MSTNIGHNKINIVYNISPILLVYHVIIAFLLESNC